VPWAEWPQAGCRGAVWWHIAEGLGGGDSVWGLELGRMDGWFVWEEISSY
jgi:hypothetical protein